ncbi:MAG: NADP-dependent malic enzyme [Candidatus Peribacteraceae bacterium]|nr:NADP-dependent malic enzyme [Candidatus Peribacteraceae bacterium]
MDFSAASLRAHLKAKGKLSVEGKLPIKNVTDLSIAYTPGVAAPCLAIAKRAEDVYRYTIKGNCVAVVTDGSAVLGLGNIGAKASLPVMEGKCALFKRFAGIDAFPIAIDSQDPDEIVRTVQLIAPIFGGINLEDISAPRCIEIEQRLIESLDIPVMHDDQHGTAIVVLAGLINALKIVGKRAADVKIALSGVGAAGSAIAKLLVRYGIGDIVLVDSKGIVSGHRDDLNSLKRELSIITNKRNICCTLYDACKDADVFIGVSKPGTLKPEMIKVMARDPIIFAMANPVPEIAPEEAVRAGAAIVATGRSDLPNQLNNSLAFPGIFRGALDAHARRITDEMKIAAASALAALVKRPTALKIIPSPFDRGIVQAVSGAVKRLA